MKYTPNQREDKHTTRYYIKNPHKVKSGRDFVICRSGWEEKFAQWCDINNSVLYWESEPIAIQYINPIKNRDARYYPDFLLKVKNKSGDTDTWLIEVKPLKETHQPIKTGNKKKSTMLYEQKTWLVNKNKWRAATRLCKMKGWKFKLITEKELFGK